MELFKELIKIKNKKLNEQTYILVTEFLIINGYLDHASYFLCQMDRNKVKIPRNILDLFLEYAIHNKIFETVEKNNKKNEEKENNKANKNDNTQFYNKYDQYGPQTDPDYAYYFSKKNHSKKRKDIQNLFSSLKIDSKPFFPRSIENKKFLNDIDTQNIKEFIPKSYKIEKKE